MSSRTQNWQDRAALVVGGSSGIGLACARRLVDQGARVWLLARRPEGLEAARAMLQGGPGVVDGLLPADVTDYDAVQAAVEQVIKAAGLPDLVINSAGITYPAYFQDTDLNVFHRLMDLNYFGAVHLAKAVIPGMLARGSGHLINIASMAAQIGTIGYTAYAGSKFALRGFSDALRSEVAPRGVRMSLVFPPNTDTPQLAWENTIKPPVVKALEGKAGQLSPEAVARVILRDAARGRYLIIPGLESNLLFRAFAVTGPLAYKILDWTIRQAERNVKA